MRSSATGEVNAAPRNSVSRSSVPSRSTQQWPFKAIGDLGEPIVHSHPDSAIAQAYLTLAGAVKAQVEAMQSEFRLPTLEFQ